MGNYLELIKFILDTENFRLEMKTSIHMVSMAVINSNRQML
jgi:hypothetical protein